MLSRRLKDVIRLRLQKTSSRHLQDVLIKTNILALLKCFQKTSSRSLDQDQYIRLGHTSSRRLQDVFQTSSRRLAKHVFKTPCKTRLQDIFKTSSSRFQDVFKTSLRHLQDFLLRLPQEVFKSKTSLRHLQNVLKTF